MTNQQGAPEALRLADRLASNTGHVGGPTMDAAAAELRRLQAENERLAALVEAQQPAAHVQNPAGIEHVAGDVSKNGAESNMAQQAAPSAAAPVGDEQKALKALHYYMTECSGHEPSISVFHRMVEEALAPQPSPTPQADSVTAPVLDRARIREIFMAHGFTVKEGQTDLKQYVYDAADALLRAARAPADSVLEDAARWQALPAFFEEYQIDAMKLYSDIDAYLAAARKQGGA